MAVTHSTNIDRLLNVLKATGKQYDTEKIKRAFEYSDVDATVIGEILSVKNPRAGKIVASGYGDIILEGSVMESCCEIIKR